MKDIPDVVLHDNTHCPYSERARRALGEKGIYQQRVPFVWHRRAELAAATGHDTVPILRDGTRVVAGSGAIARYADDRAPGGVRLFPAAEAAAIAAWEGRANEMASRTFPLVVPVWADAMSDGAERTAFLDCHRHHGDYATLVRDRLKHWNTVMAMWREADAALARKDYLLGELTYADLAMYGSVYLAAQFHAFEVPPVLERLAAWYETLRTAGMMRDQELLLDHPRRNAPDMNGDTIRRTSRYGDPPQRPEESGRQTY